MRVPRPNSPVAYGLAALAVGLTAGFRYLSADTIGVAAPMIPFVIPVVLASWYGGPGPGVLATVLGAALGDWLFVSPAHSMAVAAPAEGLALLLFLTSGITITLVSGAAHAAQARSEAERERAQLVADAVPALIAYIDAGARYQSNNRAYERWFGCTSAQVRGRHMREVLGDRAWEAIRPHVERTLAGETVTYQAQVAYREGGTRWIDATYTPDFDARGQVRGFVAHVNDVTAVVTSQRLLRAGEERLRSFSDNTPLAVVELDADFLITRWTGQATALFGWTADEAVGSHLLALGFVHPEDHERLRRFTERLLDPATTVAVQRTRNLTRSGQVRLMEWYTSVLHDDAGRTVAVQALGLDVTEREATQEQLRRRVEELEALMEFMPVAVIRADDPECRHMTGNREAYTLLRVPPGHNLSMTAPPEQRPSTYRAFQNGVEVPPQDLPMQLACRLGVEVRGEDYEIVYDDGTRTNIYGYARPLFGADGTVRGCLFAALDVTARTRTEESLRRAEERFRASQEASLFGFTILNAVRDAEGHITDFVWDYLNPAAARLLRRAPDSLIGRTLLDTFPHSRDGSDLFDRYVHVVETGEPHDYELHYTGDGLDGWFHNMTVRLGDGVAVSFNDVTERHQREEALQEADRRKDEFLATLAHELRNPLAPVRAAVRVLKMRGPADPELRWSRDIIERQVALMARLLDDLLDVNRITRGALQLRRRRLTLRSVVENAVETSQPLIEAGGHHLSVTLPDAPVFLDADPIRLAQVFANLLNNAAKYTEPPGTITLRADCVGAEVAVTVTDSGIGIDPRALPHIFEMFSQATPAIERSQGGLGIGLSLSKGLVEMHGGTIAAASEGPGTGSTFVVRLPLAATDAGVPAPAARTDAASRVSCRVVVADDNQDAADSLSMMLEMMGHTVRTAPDGQAAVDEAERFRPHVMLVDIGMPRMNGYEAARAIRARPWGADVFLVALTGWGQDDDRRRALEAGFNLHLVKPVSPDELEGLLAGLARSHQTERG